MHYISAICYIWASTPVWSNKWHDPPKESRRTRAQALWNGRRAHPKAMESPFHTCRNCLPAPPSSSTSQVGAWHRGQQWGAGQETSWFCALKLLHGRNTPKTRNISLKPLSFRTSLNAQIHGEDDLAHWTSVCLVHILKHLSIVLY